MRLLIALSTLAAALAATGTAVAGGWATVGFAPLPDGTQSGETWRPQIKILQHGVTPLADLTPTLTIREADSGQSSTFTATPTAEPGMYEAEVVIPSPGRWGVLIDSGFGDSRVTYGPVTIGSAPATGDPRTFPVLPILAGAGGLVLVAVGLLGVLRLRRLAPASR